jgi:sec-independent protein translocase protein TatC
MAHMRKEKPSRSMFDDEKRMTFIEHLAELRTRLIRSFVAFLIGFVVCYIFAENIFDLIRRPLEGAGIQRLVSQLIAERASEGELVPPEYQVAPEGTTPIAAPGGQAPAGPEAGGSTATGPAGVAEPPKIRWLQSRLGEYFFLSIRLASYAGFLVSLPYILYQACAFIFPGLKPNEKRVAMIILFGCGFLSIVGTLVAYWGVFPLVLPYILQWTPEGVETLLSISSAVNFILVGLLGFALAFQFPMVVLLLVYLDVLSVQTLKQQRRIAIVLLAVAAAVLTPPDPISMMFMLTPLVLLYEASIWLGHVIEWRRKRVESTATT